MSQLRLTGNWQNDQRADEIVQRVKLDLARAVLP
jgi:hypothetical protein